MLPPHRSAMSQIIELKQAQTRRQTDRPAARSPVFTRVQYVPFQFFVFFYIVYCYRLYNIYKYST
jgi:hypothetical protein